MKKFNRRYTSVALSIAAMTTFAAANTTAYAQDQGAQPAEEITVTGTRQVIQNSIDQKRIETQIVDGLSADEIGDIPALSIGEALETITGASSHRENGGATEVSIRGLGPFLTNTVLNGRTATNGAGNRAVNFSIFPSELFNKI
ncbi:MAG: TonB-dependent receptor plug domain-containing protein [Acidiferrobacterales bacterium]|nr:TonB-dependent receptor plug domain-containing protein [Acidiferrobacterales bacterium]